MSFAVYQTTFALFGARRFGFDAAHTATSSSAFGVLGVIVQGGLVGPVVRVLGRRRTLVIGLLFAAAGWGGSALTYSLPVFVAMLVAGRDRHRPVQRDAESPGQQRRVRRDEQGRVQGAAGALESLGRTIGPVWGNASLQRFGEGTAYGAAAGRSRCGWRRLSAERTRAAGSREPSKT